MKEEIHDLRLSARSGRAISVDFGTANGTAVAGLDYLATNGTVLIPAGVLLKRITIPVLGNTVSESNETFFVNLSNVVNATLGDAQGAGNVRDNDRAPTVAVGDAQTDFDTDGRFAEFTVRLSAPSEKPVTVNVVTARNSSGAGAAVPGVDYVAYLESPLFFPPGTSALNVKVRLLNDPASAGKRFYLTTTSAVNAVLADRLGTCVIP